MGKIRFFYKFVLTKDDSFYIIKLVIITDFETINLNM